MSEKNAPNENADALRAIFEKAGAIEDVGYARSGETHEPRRVRAKFKVNRIEREQWGGGKEVQTIVLTPVYSNDPASENAKFYAATPSGEIKLGTVNADAAAGFELGREYYVDFTPAE